MLLIPNNPLLHTSCKLSAVVEWLVLCNRFAYMRVLIWQTVSRSGHFSGFLHDWARHMLFAEITH